MQWGYLLCPGFPKLTIIIMKILYTLSTSNKNVVRLQATAPLLVNTGYDERFRVLFERFFQKSKQGVPVNADAVIEQHALSYGALWQGAIAAHSRYDFAVLSRMGKKIKISVTTSHPYHCLLCPTWGTHGGGNANHGQLVEHLGAEHSASLTGSPLLLQGPLTCVERGTSAPSPAWRWSSSFSWCWW